MGVGGGFRHDPKELDRRLKKQRQNTLSRTQFDELKKAELAAADRADEVRNAAQQEALNKAADAAADVQDEANRSELTVSTADINELAAALNAAAHAGKAKEAIQQANIALALAEHMASEMRAANEDDEEAIMLLLS